MIKSEHLEQVDFVSWFAREFPFVRIFAIPNGGYRGIREAGRLKAEGVRSGVPDLFVPAWRLWVEMKRVTGGRLSPEQKDWIEYLEMNQYSVIVAFGCDDGQRQIREFLDLEGYADGRSE